MPLVAWSPLTQAPRASARVALVEVKVQARERDGARLAKTSLVDAFLPFVFGCQRPVLVPRSLPVARRSPRPRKKTVELIGIEPTTSSLQSWRSTN
jgi:hypothetical protein